MGQPLQVNVAINGSVAAGCPRAEYDGVVQFTNATNGVGNTTRAVHLTVGVQPTFTETFDGGLGSFTVGSESDEPLALGRWLRVNRARTLPAKQSVLRQRVKLHLQQRSGGRGNCHVGADHDRRPVGRQASLQVRPGNRAQGPPRPGVGPGFRQWWGLRCRRQQRRDPGWRRTHRWGHGGMGWLSADVDLSPLLVSLSRPLRHLRPLVPHRAVRFAFDSVDSQLNAYMGFAVDDIQILQLVGPPVNKAPVVNAGPDLTVFLTPAATLAGTVTDDGLPNPQEKSR